MSGGDVRGERGCEGEDVSGGDVREGGDDFCLAGGPHSLSGGI